MWKCRCVDVGGNAAAADGNHENDDNEEVDDKNDVENVYWRPLFGIWKKPFAGNTFQNNAMRRSVSPNDPWSATVQAKSN